MAYGATLLFLLILSIEDIKERRLSLKKIILFGMSGLLYFLLKTGFRPGVAIGDLIPGILLLVLALLTKESIGYGDGFTVMALGLWMGGMFTLYTLWLAASASGIFGLIKFFRKKKEPMPFLPFLFLGTVIAAVSLWGKGVNRFGR